MQTTQFINIISTVPLIPPRVIKEEFPQTESANRTVIEGRQTVQDIIEGKDERELVIVGPCSIHDEKAAIDYAERLGELRKKVEDRLFIVMRVYFEKPRTTIGWKGLINDPHMDGSFDIQTGLRIARRLFLQLAEMGIPTGTEMLDPITPPYLSDLVTWASIGARTTESQTHRQMASGLSMPVGFKNSTEGDIQVAIDAIEATRHPHSFLGIDFEGQTCVVNTRGNQWGHLILRGGRMGPNYDEASVADAARKLREANVLHGIMVDCSHANSRKDYRRQEEVWTNVLKQIEKGDSSIMGLMLESNIHEGNQKLMPDPDSLKYGISVTDACISWEKTEYLILQAHQMLSRKAVPA